MLSFSFFRPCILAGLLFLGSATLYSQEQLGMRLETHSGMYGAALNPSATAFMPHNWEVNLFNAGAFFENNYAFLQNTSLQQALRNSDRIVAVSDISPERPAPADAILLDYFDRNRHIRAVANTQIGGPGFSFRFGENNVLGLSTGIRGGVSAYRVPSIFHYPQFSEVKIGQTIDLQPFTVGSVTWGEIGLHYSHSSNDGDRTLAWGISPKFLMGFAAGYGKSNATFQYTPGSNDTAFFNTASWEYGLSGNLLDSETLAGGGSELGGFGAGIDLGISWAGGGEEAGDYRWRAGISLLDLGFIRFSRGAEQHLLRVDTLQTLDGNALNADDVQGYTRLLSDLLMGDPLASLQGNAFSIGLPTALSAQLDVQALPHWYVAAVAVQRVPLFKNSLKRTSTLALVPRFEHRWASVSLPLVLNDWQSLRLGLAARLGWLYLGSDNLGSFFKKDRLSGSDVYIGLKINGFSFGSRDNDRLHKERGGRSKGNRKKIKCYQF